MMNVTSNIINEINTHHTNAIKMANDAIKSAKRVGELLLEVKATLPHGTLIKWIETYTKVPVRQAQRYMNVARGKTVPIRELAGKNDKLSYLSGDIFTPLPRHIFFAQDVGSINNHYLVESCSQYPEFFFITHLPSSDGPDEMTSRPVEAVIVHETLIYYGMQDPCNVKWLVKKSNGVMEAGETLYGPSENPPKSVVPRLSPRPINLETLEVDWDFPTRNIEFSDEFKRLMELENQNKLIK